MSINCSEGRYYKAAIPNRICAFIKSCYSGVHGIQRKKDQQVVTVVVRNRTVKLKVIDGSWFFTIATVATDCWSENQHPVLDI